MKKVLDEKCPNCGASLKFNSKKEKFLCDYCQGEFTLEEIKEKKKETSTLKSEFNLKEDLNGYHCDNCGAEIISLDNITSTTCLYCKSTAIIKNRLSGIYKPDSIITFKYEKEDAIKAFQNLCKGRLLLPKDFSNLDNIQEMQGLYVPFWLYDIDNEAYLKADCTKVTTWVDRKNVYTKTSFYEVERGGELSFESVPNDAAIRFDDTIMNAIEPFDYKDLKDFEIGYLAGFLSEKYDVSKEDAYQNIEKRINLDSRNYLESKISSYETKNIKENTNQLTVKNTKYVLLPVWVLNLKYKDKIYHFAMNGQSGKLVGEIPVDIKKLLLLIFSTFIGVIVLLLGIFLLLGFRW